MRRIFVVLVALGLTLGACGQDRKAPGPALTGDPAAQCDGALDTAFFDRMLDRLERAAHTQRQLIEETSHELRTPLSVLVTNAEVTLAHPVPTLEVYQRGLERSRRAALRLQTTVDRLLLDARGRARTIARHPADVTAIVRGVAGDAAVLAAARHVTLTLTGAPVAIAPVDESTVARAVSNLLDNAIKYAQTNPL